MSLGKYILFMAVIAAVCWVAFVVVLFSINPFTAGFLGFVIFYLTLLFSLTTTFAVLGLIFRRFFSRQIEPPRQAATALRQGILLSFLFIGALILLSFNFLAWWNLLLLVAFLAVIEFLFLSFQYKKEI